MSKKIQQKSLPESIKHDGKFKDGLTWTDMSGTHIVVISETGIIPSPKKSEIGERDAELFAYHYLKTKDSTKLVWKVYDGNKNCPVDVEAYFVKNSLAVSDLDNNGAAEIWMMYKTFCHGDVSPSDMKIIMYENLQKFAARGTTRVKVSETESSGGKFTLDEAFENGSPLFRKYANALWEKNVLEKF